MNPRISNSQDFSIRLVTLIALLLIGAILATSDSTVAMVIGIFILGAMFAHAVELQHQCLHHSAFKSRSVNRVVGILLGMPTLTSFHAYRRSHLEHHRNLGTESDTPFFYYRFMNSPSMTALMADTLGLSHIKASLSAILGGGDSRLISLPKVSEQGKYSEQFDYALMGFLLVCVGLISMYIGPAIFLKLWLLPFLFVAQPIHFLIELPEHIGCNAKTTDVFHNTRTIVGTRFSRWFTNYNNLHVEHHLEPAVNMRQLPVIYTQFHGQHRHLSSTYWQFYLSLYRSITSQGISTTAPNHARRPA